MIHHKLQVRNLTFSYPDGQEAIKNMSFDIMPGESVGIIGANGAGKSTLLMLLMGILTSKNGEIIVGEEKLNKKTLSKNNILAAKNISKKYPNLKEPLLTRHIAYNETVRFCEDLERQGKALILRPSEEGALKSFEKDINKLKAGYNLGYKTATDNLDKIKELFR